MEEWTTTVIATLAPDANDASTIAVDPLKKVIP
jgi:hypothetical protein